ncbi:hypothetical protein ACP4OV_014268 [Aristida adscensionis]
MTNRKSNRSSVKSHTALHMEWDRISCPICMEQPHNAVLLMCSSYKNGCRCYICNTSHRHSNCLDRFRKMNGDSKVPHYNMISRRSRSPRLGRHVASEGSDHSNVNSGHNPDGIIARYMSEIANYHESTNSVLLPVVEGGIVTGECHDAIQSSAEVKCPLCRGSVSGWIPAGEVRQYLDTKFRSCFHDSCKFVGTYEQLREHARTAHLLTKPAHVDVSRKRTWDRLEREQEFGDVISAIRSQIPGAIIVGDYVIDTRDTMSPDIDSGDESGEEWWSEQVSPDNGLGSPRHWSGETLGSPSNWPVERHGLPRHLSQNNRVPRLLPQNSRASPRFSFSDRRSLRSDWPGIRRPSTQSLVRRSSSNRYPGHHSNYHGYHRMILNRSNYAGNRGSNRSPDDPSLPRSRRQRLQYAHRSDH